MYGYHGICSLVGLLLAYIYAQQQQLQMERKSLKKVLLQAWLHSVGVKGGSLTQKLQKLRY